jgi:integrase
VEKRLEFAVKTLWVYCPRSVLIASTAYRLSAQQRIYSYILRAPVLQDFSDRFLEWGQSASLEQKTKTYYQTGWRLLSMTPLAKMKLDYIAADDIYALRFPASASNANCALRTLRRMLHKAEEWKLIFRVPKFRLMKEHGRSMTIDADIEAKLIAAAALCNWRTKSFELFRDVVILMRDTGMRNERELYRSRIENIDRNNKFIFVPDSKTPSGTRRVPMSNRVLALLNSRCSGRSEGWVFPSERSRAGHLTTVGKLFRQAREKAGLPKDLVLYCGRHDYGTRILQETGNLAAVMKTMGHKDVRTAMRYQHPELDIVRDALNATQTMTIQ